MPTSLRRQSTQPLRRFLGLDPGPGETPSGSELNDYLAGIPFTPEQTRQAGVISGYDARITAADAADRAVVTAERQAQLEGFPNAAAKAAWIRRQEETKAQSQLEAAREQTRAGVAQEEARTRGMREVERERRTGTQALLDSFQGGGGTGGGEFRPSINAQGKVSFANPSRQLGRTHEMIAGADASIHSLGKLETLLPSVESRLGPLMGRLSAYGLKTPGVSADPNFATFNAETATLRNATIKAITGAQMSEPEAQRIREQIPDVSDKPEVWRAKATATRDNLSFLRQRLVALSGGDTDVDVADEWEQVGP